MSLGNRFPAVLFGDDGDMWDVDRDMYRHHYVLRNQRTGATKHVPIETFSPELWSKEISSRYQEQLSYEKQWRPKPTRRSIDKRWEVRMLRLKQKATERRLRRVTQAGWILGWVWGTILATIVTVKLVALVGGMVLG